MLTTSTISTNSHLKMTLTINITKFLQLHPYCPEGTRSFPLWKDMVYYYYDFLRCVSSCSPSSGLFSNNGASISVGSLEETSPRGINYVLRCCRFRLVATGASEPGFLLAQEIAISLGGSSGGSSYARAISPHRRNRFQLATNITSLSTLLGKFLLIILVPSFHANDHWPKWNLTGDEPAGKHCSIVVNWKCCHTQPRGKKHSI